MLRFDTHRICALAALALLLATPAVAARLTEEISETYPFAADGRISLENINGDVVIEGWDRDEVALLAIKKASSQARLDRLKVEIDASPERLRIVTRHRRHEGGWRGGHQSVDYTLRVPRGARLDEIDLVNGSLLIREAAGRVRASLVNGDLIVERLAGDAELSTVNGGLEADFAALDGRRSIDLSSVNGRVEIFLPAGAGAEIEASTVHGSIRNDLGLEVERGRWVGESLRGRVGDGAARIDLETVNGSIRIRG